MTKVPILQVLLHGCSVGSLTLLPGDQTLFAFDQDYIKDPVRPTLSLSFKKEFGGLIEDQRPTRARAPSFFSNLLPEGPLREYLAKQAGVPVSREFFLLHALGKDLPGALELKAENSALWSQDLALPTRHTGQKEQQEYLRFSLAGVQLKFSALLEASGGLTIPAQGVGGSWIVKLPSMQFEGVVENEFSMLELARQVGIEVPELRLVDLKNILGLPSPMQALKGQALAVKRFDRLAGGQKVHIEDFAQVFGVYPEAKYQQASYRNIAQVLWAEIGEEAIREFIRRLVFNALIGNADMHLKNWSLIYPEASQAALAPAYDFVSTIAYPVDDKMALSFLKSKRFEDLSLAAFEKFAKKARLPKHLVLESLKQSVELFHQVWQKELKHLPLSKAQVKNLKNHLKKLPLAKI